MAKKNEIEDIKEVAKLKYITTKLTAKDIAILLGVTEKTVGKWRKDGAWDELRDAFDTQPQLLVQTYLRAMAAINKLVEDEKRAHTPSELDSLSKLSRMVKDLRQGHTPQVVMEVMNEFNNYLAMVDMAAGKIFTPYSLAFVAKKYKDNK